MAATAEAPMVKKGFKGLGMEGPLAHWYARNTGGAIEQFRQEARRLAGWVSDGASILEVAPGPGYLAIELARLGASRSLAWTSARRSWSWPPRTRGSRVLRSGFSTVTHRRCRSTLTRSI